MNEIQSRQQRRNAASRDRWQVFEAHRRTVTRLLTACDPSNRGRLCVLGAGNCNDLVLKELVETYGEIHLVDLDATALEQGVARQKLGPDPNAIHLHKGIDVTGIGHLMERWSPGGVMDVEEADRCIEYALAAQPGPLPKPCSVVASTCLLSQLLESLGQTLGPHHHRFHDLLGAILTRHLRLLVELTIDGGEALLITDFTSSDGWPELPSIPAAQLPKAAIHQIRCNNFFIGMNPFLLRAFFLQDPVATKRSQQADLLAPWRWTDGARTYAVCAVKVRCGQGPQPRNDRSPCQEGPLPPPQGGTAP